MKCEKLDLYLLYKSQQWKDSYLSKIIKVNQMVNNFEHTIAIIVIAKVAYTFLLIKGAMVGLERSVYQTAEGVGVVEVCAIVYYPHQECPIVFPFNITLSTVDHNASTCQCVCNNTWCLAI